MRLGISSYTFAWAVGIRGYSTPPQPLTAEGLLQKAVQLGVRVVQIADNLPLDRLSEPALDELSRQARQLGIDLEVGTAGTDPDHLRAYLSLAVRLRSPLLRLVLDTEHSRLSPHEAVQALRQVLPEFAAANVCLAIENHDRFPAATLADLLEQLGGEHVGICLDTANSLGCGEGLDTLLRVLGRRVVNLHVKDFRARRLSHGKGFLIEGCPAGDGLVDIPGLLADLLVRGRDPNAILELWAPPEASAREDDWAAESVRYLRRFIPD